MYSGVCWRSSAPPATSPRQRSVLSPWLDRQGTVVREQCDKRVNERQGKINLMFQHHLARRSTFTTLLMPFPSRLLSTWLPTTHHLSLRQQPLLTLLLRQQTPNPTTRRTMATETTEARREAEAGTTETQTGTEETQTTSRQAALGATSTNHHLPFFAIAFPSTQNHCHRRLMPTLTRP